MLLRVTIKNFLSFYHETTFDMFPNIKRTSFSNHIYSNHKVPLLKQAVIYGANGSGKSNLLKTFKFIKDFAIKKDFLDRYTIDRNKFRLVEQIKNNPSLLSVEFTVNKIYYKYSFELNSKKIKEELVVSGLGEVDDQLIYSRDGKRFKSGNGNDEKIDDAIKKLIERNPYSSLLSLNSEFPIFENVHMKQVFNWFDNKFDVLSLNRILPALIEVMSKKENLLTFANEIFTKVDLGIEAIGIESKNINELLIKGNEESSKLIESLKNQITPKSSFSKMKNDKILFSLVEEKGESFIKQFIFKQTGIGNYSVDMDIEDQSDGTVKLLNLIPALYDVIKNGKIICIDEIENSIHPSLITSIMSYFSNSKSKGQLIFTTHETELLNQKKYMRADEIWFTEKHEGNTKLYSLNDFKEHNTINLRNGYLDGRYGAIPNVSSFQF